MFLIKSLNAKTVFSLRLKKKTKKKELAWSCYAMSTIQETHSLWFCCPFTERIYGFGTVLQ